MRHKVPQLISELLTQLSIGLYQGRIRRDEIGELRQAMDQLAPAHVVMIEQCLPALVGLTCWNTRKRVWFRAFKTDAEWLSEYPDLALPFLYHRDGRIREAALKQLSNRSLSAFALASVMYRLNDWVKQVRVAASTAARRVIATSDTQTVADATVWLATQSRSWGRWQDHAVLAETLAAPRIVSVIGRHIREAETGPLAALMRQMLAQASLDTELQDLAAHARLSSVRAAATEALIFGRARWPIGWEKKWIDKSMHQFRWGRVFSERPLTIQTEPEDIIIKAANDHAASVRKIAADAIVRGVASNATAQNVIARLRADPNPGIRERIDYVLRTMAKD